MNAEHFPDCRLGHAFSNHSSDGMNIFIRQLGPAMCLTKMHKPLHNSIGHVVLVSPKEEMMGAYAWPVVALVADKELARIPEVDLPRNAMGSKRSPYSTDIELPVTVGVFRRQPHPTVVGALAVYFGPEAGDGTLVHADAFPRGIDHGSGGANRAEPVSMKAR
jgi:hypothetical protein